MQYGLPHPLTLLQEPPTKPAYKRLVKSKVVDYWEVKLRIEASKLSSLEYFKPAYMSLTKPHLLWTSCGSSSFETHKALITAKMLAGRYLTDSLQRHWTDNKAGVCLLPACKPLQVQGTLVHILLYCASLHEK